MIRIENNRIHIGDLLRRFFMVRDEDPMETISPSKYTTEMNMTVEERLKLLNDRSRIQKIGKQNRIWTIPDLVVFQNFEILSNYSTTISFIHQKQHPVRIQVRPDLSPCFTLRELPGTVYSKLAPGTPHKLTLNFFSEEHRDYLSFIRFDAEGDIISLPIVALAPRPLLIFPDVIELSETVVNIPSDKRIFMKNSGKTPVDFIFHAELPFCVCPKLGVIEPNGVLDIKVSYKNCKVQQNNSNLIIIIEGIELCTKLICQAKNCEIFLDKTALYFQDTFLNLQRCLHLKLINNSRYTMKYQWKQFETKYAEMKKCEKYRHKLKDINEYEVLRNIQDENPNITDAELHKTFMSRIYSDELAEFDSTDQFLFHDKNFKLETSGIIGPHSTIDIEVVFRPCDTDTYVRWTYFDVTGRETRQPLKMVGTGLGPVVHLHAKNIDAGNLYLCAKHQYEVIAKNGGIIPATLSYCHRSLDFGGSMTCTPPEVNIDPGICEKMVLEFSSTVQGQFLEQLKFKIVESQEYLDLIFRGNVICPLLSYDVEELDFGSVAFGFAVEKEISMQNNTEVPIEFKISILNDGVDEAITWVNFSMHHDERLVSATPKEFNIHPNEATVAGNSAIKIRITLIPNKVRERSTVLQTYMWGSKKHNVEVPIFYNCVVPTIECIPPRLDIRYCFINCPYDRAFTLKNVSDVAGYILYNETDHDFGLTCNLSLKETYIEPGEIITIHLEIKGMELGLHTNNLNFTIFGLSPSTLCKLTCDVQGPVVCVNTEEIKFGSVQLLKWQNRSLQVMNDSPVSADISITVANPIFHVSPSEFVLEASEKLGVEVSIFLTYCAKYSSVITLNIVNNSDPLRVPVTATGVGCCVLFEPTLEPEFNLGTLMTHNYLKVPFKMTNMGRETQRLCFSTNNNIRTMKIDPSTLKGYPFIVEPNLFEIGENDTKTGFVETYNSNSGPVELMYYCYSFEKGSRITKIFNMKLMALFEDPVLSLSKRNIHFRMDVTYQNIDCYLKETFTVTNDTYLALDIYVSLDPPFFLHDTDGSLISLINTNIPSKEDFSFVVEFVPPSQEKRCNSSSGVMIIGFKLHPRTFHVPLIGDVNYPSVVTFPDSYANQQVAPMAIRSRQFILKNVSPLIATYKFEWDEDSYCIEKIPTPRFNSTLEYCTDFNMSHLQDKFIETKQVIEEKEELRYALESIFSDNTENVGRMPTLKTIKNALLHYQRLPQIHPDSARRMLRVCNQVLGFVVQNMKDDIIEYRKALKNMPMLEKDINEAMLNITPYQGFLEPFECNLVSFYIRPPMQTFIKATVRCQILGGIEERIEVSGGCGELAFDIDKTDINFGNQLFCEILETVITLTNTGYIAFEFAVNDNSYEVFSKHQLDKRWINVSPYIGNLDPGESVNLVLKYYPGMTGEFQEYFTVEIGYLRAILVRFHGFGLYSQLSILLPRPNLIEDADYYFCYNAIASLTNEGIKLHHVIKSLNKEYLLDETTSAILQKEGWAVIEVMDEDVPSLVDIDMAIERKIGYEYLQSNPQLYSRIKKKNFVVPNFTVPAYTISFGNVRLDVQYQRDITLYNYGAGTCVIRLVISDKKLFVTKGLIAVLDTQKIKLNEFANLSITFQPNSKNSDIQFLERIFIEVYQGAKIPIDITASIGTPLMELSNDCLDFYGVIVGYCKRKTMSIHNTGFVEVKWTCSIDSSLFFVKKHEGVLYPDDVEIISIFFEPKAKGSKNAKITFRIEGSNQEYAAYLNGCGLEPRLIVKETLIKFKPALQYSPAAEKTFLIQNISGFPNEIFFSDYDRQSPRHDRIKMNYWKLKNAKKVYVAQSCFGTTPSDIYRFMFNEILMDMIKKGGSYTDLMKHTCSEIMESDDLMDRTLDLMDRYAENFTTDKKSRQSNFIDTELSEKKYKEELKSNTIIVFYGNKYTDYLKAATDTSKMLRIPRFTLDGMIVDILVQNSSIYAEEVNKVIEDAYFDRMGVDDCVCRISVIEDKTEEMWRRIEVISKSKSINKRINQKLPKKKDKTEKSEKSSANSNRSSKKVFANNTTDTFQGISEELITQILSKKIEQNEKFILESLKSIFLPNEHVALRCFLKAAKNISCVYFVFLTCTYEEHSTLLREETIRMKAEEMRKKEEVRKKMLDIHEYSNLAENEFNVLQEMQEERRRNISRKRMELRVRIQGCLNQYNYQTKANDLKTFWDYMDQFYRYRINTSAKLPSKTLKISGSQNQNLLVQSRGTKESKGSGQSNSEKGSQKNVKSKRSGTPRDGDASYFYQFDVKLCEILHLLEHWDRRSNEMTKPFPNFASMISSGKGAKDTSKANNKTSKGRSKSITSSSLKSPNEIDDDEITASILDPNIGYPVWLISQAHQKRFPNYITSTVILLKRVISMNCSTTTQHVGKEIDVTYSVLKKPSPRERVEKPKIFELIKSVKTTEDEKIEALGLDNENVSPTSSTSTTMKKKTKKRKLTLVSTASEMEQMKAVPVRFILEPDQIQEVTVLFKPLYSGTFKCSYFFEVVGTHYSQKVDVIAYCDYPRIDTSPNTMFPHRVQNVDSKSMFLNGIYVISQQILDFGTLLFIPHNLLETKSTISMLNTSTMICYVAVLFRNESDTFFCDENDMCIIIGPGRQHCVTIYAKPSCEGLFRETLLIIIRNNPIVQQIDLSCYSCSLKFEVNPKHINFNKVILGKTETEKVYLYNHTAVMVYFELDFDLSSEFRLNLFNGYLEPCSVFELTISYTPEDIGDRKEFITIKIFDREKQYPEPVHKELLTILAEVATFCLQYPTNVDLGLVRGKSPLFFPFTITNTGKYEVKVILTKANDNSDKKKICDYFKMKHMEYVVKGDSKYSNNCRFICNKELSFTNVPIMYVTILDNYRNAAVDCFTLKASGSVALSKFELCPYGDYFFGYQDVNTTRSSIFTLRNTGKFQFSYTILTPKIVHGQSSRKKFKKDVIIQTDGDASSIPSIVEADVTPKKSSARSRRSTSGSLKKRKSKAKTKSFTEELITGVFTISPSRGVVQPDKTTTITIYSSPTECRKYAESIIIYVSEPSSEDHRGRILNLHVEGTEPSISFTDYDFMFPELYIAKNVEDLPYVGENFVFETSKQKLNFGKVAVNNSVKTRFRIPNTGHVTASVHYDIREKDSDFTVSSRVVEIAPYQSEFNSICFSPKSIGIKSGILDIKCQGFSSGNILSQRLSLIGEACMPTVQILEPQFRTIGDIPKIDFDPIFLNEFSEKMVILKNDGSVPCRVIVEICEDPQFFLSVTAQTESDSSGCDTNRNNNIGALRYHSIYLNIEEKVFINLTFRSTSEVTLRAQLNISVVNNCFDIWKIPVTAHCFSTPVALKDINMTLDENNEILYSLDFGYLNKNELQKLYFKIKNFSMKMFRFEFGKISGLTFYPSIGHIYARSEKNVVAGFHTNRNVCSKLERVLLTVTEIQLTEGPPILSWDDRQDCIIFNPNSSTQTFRSQSEEIDQEKDDTSEPKQLEETSNEKCEPKYNVVDTPFQLPLLISAQCSFSNYYCETREMIFPVVQLHSETMRTIYVENRSAAYLRIQWTLMNAIQFMAEETANSATDFSEVQQLESPTYLNSESLHFEDSAIELSILNEAFKIEPTECSIPPDEEQDFKITFFPTKNMIHKAILKANMKNLNPETSDLEIALKGEILHFPYQFQSRYLEDYTLTDSKFKLYCGYIAEENAKVLHFLALGVISKCSRTIFVMNDMNSSMSYNWKKVKTDLEEVSYFHCEKPEGCILPGKMIQTDFMFIPQYHGTFTDSFCFMPNDPKLPKSSLLLIGHCREPRIYYEHPYLKMKTTLINTPIENEIIMQNDEEESVHFQFKKSTLASSDQQILSVSPTSGMLQPKSRNKIRFSSQSSKCGETIFNIECIIQYMSNPLQLNVITNVIQVTSGLIYYSKEMKLREMKPYTTNVIDLGVIIPHKKEELRFELQNTCSVGFYYSWITEDKQHKTRIQLLQEKGYLTSFGKRKFAIILTALRRCVVKNILIKLHVLHGPSYIFRIEASADKPMYSFSFLKYDFGKCIVQQKRSKFYHTALVFTNHNTRPTIIENGNSRSSEFLTDFRSIEVKPNESISIDIFFSPTEAKLYSESVTFFIDSNKFYVKLFGQGVPLGLQVLNISEKYLNFGAVRVGKIVQKAVKILNHGEATVNALFDFLHRIPEIKSVPKKYKEEYIVENSTKMHKSEELERDQKVGGNIKKRFLAKEKSISVTKEERSPKSTSNSKLLKTDDKKKDSGTTVKSLLKNNINSEMMNAQMDEEMNQFLTESFEIIPRKSVTITPGSTTELIIKFKPKTYKEQFQANIFFEVHNYKEPIVHITGSAVEANFRLNKEVVAFGNVVVGYPNEETIVLINDGRIGGKFKWHLERKSSYVSFIGGEGFSPPNSKVITTVVFKPGHVQCFFRFKAYCKIENYDKQLDLLLTGGSMNVPPPLETIKFETAVREETAQSIIFKNETKEAWNTKPIFSGAFFSGNEMLHVPKESSVSYEISYSPMKYSSFPHEGTIFFPLPCGFSRLYSLKGIVSLPKPAEVISRDITSKTYHTEILKVKNWLGLRQTFKVITEVIEVDSVRIIYKITSNELLEVSPHGRRDFKWTIYVLNEGKLSLKVSFLNEKSKEYIYYQITLRVTSSESTIETMKLSTCVRIPTTKTITIKNPLHEPLEYTTTTSSPHIYMENMFKIPPYQNYQLAVKYLPVKVESTSVRLHIDNPQIGGYNYNLILEAHASNLEPTVHFKTDLGQSVSETILLPQDLHNSDVNAKISENTCFEVLRLNTQTENSYVDICFNPADLGISRGFLHIFSYMGEHTYPLIGECLKPKAQGPFIMKYGDTINIEFTNPFEESKMFQFTVDNNCFQVHPPFETIRGKKSTRVSITAYGQRMSKDGGRTMNRIESMGSITGKMFIICEYENSSLYWIYYLQYEVPNK